MWRRPKARAIDYGNGGVLEVPTYRPGFVMKFKRAIPPHVRLFHGRHYVIVAPHHRRAFDLAEQYFDLERVTSATPYDFLAEDRALVLQQQRRRAGRRAA